MWVVKALALVLLAFGMIALLTSPLAIASSPLAMAGQIGTAFAAFFGAALLWTLTSIYHAVEATHSEMRRVREKLP